MLSVAVKKSSRSACYYLSWSVIARCVVLGLMASGSSPPPPPPHLGYRGQVGYHNQPGPNVHGEVSFMFMLLCQYDANKPIH